MTDPVTEARDALARAIAGVSSIPADAMPPDADDGYLAALILAALPDGWTLARAEAGAEAGVSVEALAEIIRDAWKRKPPMDSRQLAAFILAARSAGSGSRVEREADCERCGRAIFENPAWFDGEGEYGCWDGYAHEPRTDDDGDAITRPTPPAPAAGSRVERECVCGHAQTTHTGDPRFTPLCNVDECLCLEYRGTAPAGEWCGLDCDACRAYMDPKTEGDAVLPGHPRPTPPPAVDGTLVACQRCGRPGYPAAAMDDARCTGGRPASWCQVHGFEAPPAPDPDRLRALVADAVGFIDGTEYEHVDTAVRADAWLAAARALLADGERSE